jgi:hypothetical protein
MLIGRHVWVVVMLVGVSVGEGISFGMSSNLFLVCLRRWMDIVGLVCGELVEVPGLGVKIFAEMDRAMAMRVLGWVLVVMLELVGVLLVRLIVIVGWSLEINGYDVKVLLVQIKFGLSVLVLCEVYFFIFCWLSLSFLVCCVLLVVIWFSRVSFVCFVEVVLEWFFLTIWCGNDACCLVLLLLVSGGIVVYSSWRI